MKNHKEKEEAEYWVTAALTNDYLVADVLLRLKHHHHHQQQPSTTTTSSSWLTPIKWGHRKSRSKPPPSPSHIITNTNKIKNTNTNVITNKEHQESGSPTTPLCWSDSFDESGPDRSNYKGALGNEGATTSSCKKSRKRKSAAKLIEEKDCLLKEREQLNTDLESMRAAMHTQIAANENLKKRKIDLHQNSEKEMKKMTSMVSQRVQTSSIVEPKADANKGFVLPDLNMTPDEETL